MGEQGFTCLGGTVIDIMFVSSLHIKVGNVMFLKHAILLPHWLTSTRCMRMLLYMLLCMLLCKTWVWDTSCKSVG